MPRSCGTTRSARVRRADRRSSTRAPQTFHGAAPRDQVRPDGKLFVRIIVSIPAAAAVESEVDRVARSDEIRRDTRGADGAENEATVAKRIVDALAPPALVAELDRIAKH